MNYTLKYRLLTIFNTYSINRNSEAFFWLYSNIQIIFLLYSYAIQDENKEYFSLLESISKLFILDCSLPDLKVVYGFLYTITIIYLLIFSICFAISLMISKTQSDQSLIIRIVKHLGIFHLHCFFVPGLSILIFILKAYANSKTAEKWRFADDNYEFILVTSIIALLVHIGFGFICSLMCTNSKFGVLVSRMPTLIDLIKLLTKSLWLWDLLIVQFAGVTSNWIVGSLCFLFEIASVVIITSNNPYLYYKTTNYLINFLSINVSILATLILNNSEKREFLVLVYSLITVGISNPLISHGVKTEITKIFDAKKVKMSQGRSLYLLSLEYEMLKNNFFAIKNQVHKFQSSELILNFYIGEHRKKCIEKYCFCEAYIQAEGFFDFGKVKSSFEKFINQTIRELWNRHIESNSKTSWLKLTCAETIINNNIELYPVAFSYITSINKVFRGKYLEFAIQNIHNKVDQHLSEQTLLYGHQVDIKMFLEYQKNSAIFREKILNNTALNLKFWSNYETETPSLMTLFDFSKEFNQNDKRIRHWWPNLKAEFNELLLEEYVLFSTYSIIVRNAETQGFEIFKEFQNKSKNLLSQTSGVNMINMQTITQQRNIILKVCMEKSHLAEIKSACGDPSHSLGYPSNEMRGIKINNLMPSYIASVHDQYILNHLKTGYKNMLYKNNFFYLVHKLGYIVPAQVLTCPSPQFEDGFNYMAIIRPHKKYEECMIFDHEGTIIGLTKNLGEELGIIPTDKKSKFSQIYSGYEDLRKILETYKWIQTNIPKEKVQNYTLAEMVFKEQKKNLIEREELYFPENDTEYKALLDFCNKFQQEGLSFDLDTKRDGLVKYNCRLSSDSNLNSGSVQFLLMNRSKSDPKKLGIESPNILNKSAIDLIMKAKEKSGTQTTFIDLPSPDLNPSSKPTTTFTSKTENFFITQKNPLDNSAISIRSNDLPSPYIQLERNKSSHATIRQTILDFKNLHDNPLLHMNKNDLYDDVNTHHGLESRMTYGYDISEKLDLRMKKFDKSQIYTELVEFSQIRDDTTATNSISSISKSRVNTKRTEMIINSPPKDNLATILKVLYMVFYLAVIVVLIYYNVYGTSIFSDMSVVLQGLIAASKRYNAFLRYNQAQRKIDMIREDTLSEFYPGFLEELEEQSKEQIEEFIEISKTYNTDIEKTYPLLPSSLVEKILEKVVIEPVVDQQESIHLPLDQALALYAANGLFVLHADEDVDTDIQTDEIIDNVLNDVLLRSEMLIETLSDYLDELIISNEDFLKRTTIAVICVSVVLGAFSTYIEAQQLKFRERFFESFCRMDDKKMKLHIIRIQHFYEVATDKSSTVGKAKMKSKPKNLINVSKISQSEKIRKKFSSKNLNKRAYLRLFSQIMTFISLVSSLIVFWRLVHHKLSIISQLNGNLSLNYKILGEYNLIISAMDNYVLDNEGELRDEPITEELWDDIEYLESNQLYYLNLRADGELDSNIMEIVQSNLCVRYADDFDEIFNCNTAAGGSLIFGINSMTSFVMENVKDLLSAFDSTAKEIDDIKEFFEKNKYYELTDLLQHVFSMPFEEISSIIKTELENADNQNQNFIRNVNIVFIILTICFAGLSFFLRKDITIEKFETQQILNLIPIQTILESPIISRFLDADVNL